MWVKGGSRGQVPRPIDPFPIINKHSMIIWVFLKKTARKFAKQELNDPQSQEIFCEYLTPKIKNLNQYLWISHVLWRTSV
ncbi:hypothetical protein LQ50_17225 [Halalkalibacter okhensis]|uniref:Uncharacterized protein n=1 Tax=Halalkalibacter okhensis TaxID=333138 RepID=A0A0B0IE47_9BACI|nr:hypothetical protein LQ50_17225 [Halalkalibacter okhensis]